MVIDLGDEAMGSNFLLYVDEAEEVLYRRNERLPDVIAV